jgi:hypothetical protein
MSVLSKQNNNRTQEIITNHQEFNSILSPKLVRMKKVLAVQKQLTEGTYDLEERLNVAIDRLLENLVA